MSAASPVVAESAGLLAVRCVRALLERHGLPKYRQSAWLADAIGLSYAQAHRKMNGAAAWTLEELERVGALLGESLADVVAPGNAQDRFRESCRSEKPGCRANSGSAHRSMSRAPTHW
jgi:hypothetical protein